jgi:hypothetical protein
MENRSKVNKPEELENDHLQSNAEMVPASKLLLHAS